MLGRVLVLGRRLLAGLVGCLGRGGKWEALCVGVCPLHGQSGAFKSSQPGNMSRLCSLRGLRYGHTTGGRSVGLGVEFVDLIPAIPLVHRRGYSPNCDIRGFVQLFLLYRHREGVPM